MGDLGAGATEEVGGNFGTLVLGMGCKCRILYSLG